jgi:cell division initiation protein
MAYTPVELRHVRVNRSLFGYNKAAVEQLLDEVADSFENVWRERGMLDEKVEGMEKQLAELRQREALLTQTLMAAERAATEVREQAKRQAEVILAEAHQEARLVTRGAQGEKDRLVAERRRVETLLRSALGMIEEANVTPSAGMDASSATVSPAASDTTERTAETVTPPAASPADNGWRDDTREFQRPNLFITGDPEARAG